MAVYFFDTSALVKRYVSETGSDAVTAIVEAPETIVVIADLTRKHGLRAYDAIQLATALRVRAIIAPHGARPSFVSADDSLLNAARSEGLPVLNPAAP